MEKKLRALLKNKKGVLGLDMVKSVFLIFIILVILGVAGTLVAISVRDVADTIDLESVTIYNESLDSNINETGGVHLDYVESDVYRLSACTITIVTNSTTSATIESGNYTTSNSGCTLAFTGNDPLHNNSIWNVTYTASYTNPRTTNIAKNYSGAVVDFFEENATIISILVVVVIIAAIGIVIAIISRFGAAGAGDLRGRSRSSSGSDTVMGI